MNNIIEYKNSTSKNPIVSICVQTFNHEKFIAKCLESILMQQTNFEFEILLGEDESSDNTRKICIEYAIKFPEKIKLFLHLRKNVVYINGSPTGRFNFLYNLYSAKGKYIALCEGDDYWTDPYKLQKQVDFLEANPAYVGCYNGCKHVDENDVIIKESRYETYHDQSAEKLLTAQGAMITHSVMFRNIIKGFPSVFDGVPSGDTILYHLLGFHGAGKFLPDIQYSAYRVHSGGIWSGIDNLQRMKNTLSTMSAIKQHLIDHFGKDTIYIHKMHESTFNNIKGYLYLTLYHRNFKMYFSMLKQILNQTQFSRSYLLKEHLKHLIQILKMKF